MCTYIHTHTHTHTYVYVSTTPREAAPVRGDSLWDGETKEPLGDKEYGSLCPARRIVGVCESIY